MVQDFVKEWKALGWYKANNPGKNATNLKEKIVEHITKKRILKKRSLIPDTYLRTMAQDSSSYNPFQNQYYFYCKGEFLQWAEDQFKTDLAAGAKKSKPAVNDIIRLFSIATSETNRDLVTNLGYGKAFKRSDLDGSMSLFDSIMTKFSIQFNDTSLTFVKPQRACYLATTQELNPNEMERILIKRNHEWMGSLYKKTLGEYNKAFKKWTKGTGGGSGSEENFQDWELREKTEEFANYSNSGSVDYLAYMLMLDKQAGYVINTINESAPDGTVNEDGTMTRNGKQPNGTPKKKRKTAVDKVATAAKEMQDDMKDILKETMSILAGVTGETDSNTASNFNQAAALTLDTEHKALDGMAKCYQLINNLEAQIEAINRKKTDASATDGGASKMEEKIGMLEKALFATYARLAKFSE